MFGDLKTAAGVKALDAFLADNSYIEGFVPSQADTAVFEALTGAPGSDTPHALRWYNHIKSFGAGMKQFAKASKDASAYTAGGAAPAADDDEDDDDVDLFGSDDDEDAEEKAKEVEARLKAYHEKKAKKPALIAKTSVLFDVKPWDDETDMNEMLKNCKSIEKEGLVWGASKLVPVGYGINKLQLMCVVEDEKVSIEELSEQICEFEDFVQSCDVAAMSKI
jgi:elongation factor 1-beta